MSREFLPGELEELGERLKIEFGIDRRKKAFAAARSRKVVDHRRVTTELATVGP